MIASPLSHRWMLATALLVVAFAAGFATRSLAPLPTRAPAALHAPLLHSLLTLPTYLLPSHP